MASHGHTHAHKAFARRNEPGTAHENEVQVRQQEENLIIPSRVVGRDGSTKVLAARATSSTVTCPTGGHDTDQCQYPVGSSSLTIPIAMGVAIPLGIAVIVLFFLHRRSIRKVRQEDASDPHKSLDFGFGEAGSLPSTKSKGGKRKGTPGTEKPGSKLRQMSMDMNLSSPYLLPPALQQSRESLHSLARTLHQNEDPYRPIAQYAGSDAGSIRSGRIGKDGESVFTKHSGDRDLSVRGRSPLPQQQMSMSPQPLDTIQRKPPPLQTGPSRISPPPALHTLDRQPSDPFLTPIDSTPAKRDSPPFPQEVAMPEMPMIQEPSPVATPNSNSGPPRSPRTARKAKSPPPPPPVPVADPEDQWNQQQDEPHHTQNSHVAGLGLMDPMSAEQDAHHAMSSFDFSHHDDVQQPQLPTVAVDDHHGQYDFGFDDQPQDGHFGSSGYDGRGRQPERGDEMMYQQEGHFDGLAVPQQDSKRLSVGFRPLPPDELMETDDPEIRANRIRSFYKEYFEDSRGGPVPPMPPPQHDYYQDQYQGQGQPHHYEQSQYFEDYDANYMGPDATYFDPQTNAFVTPYSQPIARRAMTPPPSGSRFAGGPRPPRGYHHGSMGGNSLRPGSSASNRPRFRAGSAMSNRSGRSGASRKPGPPPAPLNTLPAPSKLRDDSFAIFNAADFAPPESISDRMRGRSQSPSGERRFYQPKVPSHSPLVNAFDELAALPSPHTLRKSGTFTALDFAPPRKFGDNSDARSETGSIRSNRSGISQVQLNALRSGAGRVSRLPGDQIFTQAKASQVLKPNWGMRD